MSAAPTPVPAKMPRTCLAPRAAPYFHSPNVPMRTSFSMWVGHVQDCGRWSERSTSRQSRFGANLTLSVPGVIWPGTPKPSPRTWSGETPESLSTLLTALSIRSNTAAGPPPGGGVASFARPRGAIPSSNRPARIFVPPRSTPIQYASLIFFKPMSVGSLGRRRLGGRLVLDERGVPVPAVAGQQLRGRVWPPRPGVVIREVLGRARVPRIQDRHHHLPRRLDL